MDERQRGQPLAEEDRFCNHFGIRFFNVPIVDRSVPDEGSILQPLETLVKHVKLGRGVGFHYRAGIWRSSMIAALVLVRLGWTPDTALHAISESRGCRVPDTLEQELWVREFARKL